MISGVVFLDKPYGWTSRQAVNAMIRLYTQPGEKRIKAGHAGTLDPLATGMLPILLGEATRYAEMGLSADKSYRVSFDLSYQTDTLDCEGEVVARFDGAVNQAAVQTALAAFTGLIEQVPPAYSAIRIDGKRAHAMARKGEAVHIPARPVTVHAITLVAFEFPLVTLQVDCSKGTYIRSLARDIGAALGMGGCVTALRRLSTGGWPEAMMVTLEQLQAQPDSCVLPLAQWLREMPGVTLEQDMASRFVQGQRIQLQAASGAPDPGDGQLPVRVFAGELLLGTGMLKSGHHRTVLHPSRILPTAQQRYI
ncbi:tRNA pseudouridine(55) synthase TruB [Mariprofundus ferrooxydans]|uniref:tRNA pseudouridine synthase B n=1 Tax=Mariprofundus ferrooxydans PV-1 TaxID=314345 RepID=Q0EZ77_9PROT|nr:tRNA pseudouridine(55) synthase TruB [Mariprofundus ferrooxydans]EAU54547.1 tRNA pseudouridine synthase B [Mariprofundus ferrooxydans PV-1]KON48841.1 tRNA pseudouridine synthase B [Mariprofundus ferrooxydans]